MSSYSGISWYSYFGLGCNVKAKFTDSASLAVDITAGVAFADVVFVIVADEDFAVFAGTIVVYSGTAARPLSLRILRPILLTPLQPFLLPMMWPLLVG